MNDRRSLEKDGIFPLFCLHWVSVAQEVEQVISANAKVLLGKIPNPKVLKCIHPNVSMYEYKVLFIQAYNRVIYIL